MLVDCDTCAVRGAACSGCVVSVLLGPPPARGLDLDDDERRALQVMAQAGLVPQLHLVPPGAPAIVTRKPDDDDLSCGYLPVDLPLASPAAAPAPARRSRSRRSAA